MRKSVVLFTIIGLVVSSCSTKTKDVKYEDKCDAEYGYKYNETLEDIMDDFYLYHLRYPRSVTDYTYMFYKSDSINHFRHINGLFKTDNYTYYCSYEKYCQLLDSLFDIKKKQKNVKAKWQYFLWQSGDLIELSSNQDLIKVINHNTKTIYAVRRLEPLIKRVAGGSPTITPFSEEWERLYPKDKQCMLKYTQIRFYDIDSIQIIFQDADLNSRHITDEILKLGDSLFDSSYIIVNKGSEFARLYFLNYNKKDGITKAFNNDIDEITIEGTKQKERLVQYLDSLIDLDKRIYFLQFCISPIGNTWETIRTGNDV